MRKEQTSTVDDFMTGGGEMGNLIRSIDWSCTPVGAVGSWPQSLRTAISIMLNTHFPMYVAWGKDFTQFYNDGYRPILGSTKHPAAMGLSTKVTFAEIWDIIGPMFEGVMEGKAVGFTDFMLPMDRHGFTEECYFIFSYSPIKQENGLTGGVLVTVTETTDRVLSERRLKTLHDLGDRSSDSKTLKDAADNILAVLELSKHDIPFSVLYLYNAETHAYNIAGSTGLVLNETLIPDPTTVLQAIPQGQAQKAHVKKIFEKISFEGSLPWPEPVESCCISMLSRPDQKNPFGFLISGLSPRLQHNDRYTNFFKLLTDQCITVLSNANAFEEERKRAEALAALDKAKTVFFSNISHEFRTPLTLMLSPVEDMINDPASRYPPESKELLSLIHRNGLRLQKLVNNLLDFSRIEAGRIHASYRAADLSQMTAELASNFRSAIERAGLTLTVSCPDLPERIFIDAEMWEKIILNLLSNAFKHTFEGGITVATQWLGNKVQVTVKDTGIGISPDQLSHLFQRFHRVPNVRSRTHEGSGIGLALVYELVKLHGGTIDVASEVDKGTTFTVLLPAGKDHLPHERIQVKKEFAESGVDKRSFIEEALRWLPAAENGSSLHVPEAVQAALHHETWLQSAFNNGHKPVIILADDNADMRDYVKGILSPLCEVRVVANGKFAWELAQKIKPDLVLSDVMMPELDGFEVVKALRNDPVLRSTPVILLSARAGEESKVEGLNAGADDYLIKPFSSRELIARVKANLQLSYVRKEAEEALRKSEGRLRAIVETTPECIKIVAPDGSLQFMNKAGLCMVEAPDTNAVLGACIFDVIAEDHREAWMEKHNRVCKGESLNWEFDIVGLTGTRRSMETHAVPLPNGDGTFSQLAVTRDITARKHAEHGLQRNETILRGQKQALEQAVHGMPLTNVLDTLVQTVEGQSSGKLLASILLVDQDGKHLRHGAAPSLPEQYNRAIDGFEIGPVNGSFGAAAYLGNEIVVSDIAKDELWNDIQVITYRQLALEHGLKACWSTPILSSKKELLATFSAYYKEIKEPSKEDREAVELLSRTAGIVIEWYQEISDRQMAENALRRSEARMRALVTATSDVIYRMSPDWTEMWRLDGNDLLEDTGEPIKNWYGKYVYYKDQERVKQAIDTAIRTKSVFQLEHQMIRGDGTLGWTFSRAVPILSKDGNITEWYGVASDVTERKRYEVALAESEAKFRRFYESGMLPIAFWNVNGKVYDCNNAFAALVGYDKQEIISGGYDWMATTAPEYRHLHEKYIRIAVGGKVFVDPYEVALVRPDGSQVNVLVGYTMLEGSKENGVAFLMDITVQKSLMTQLEARVTERTQALNAVNHALQQSNDDLLQFAHVASHDLKEPVRKIKTFANRLKDESMGSLNESATMFLNKVLSSADRMSMMIEGVLAYSSVNATEKTVELVDLNHVLIEIKNDLEVVIQHKHAVVEHDHLPLIEGSRFLLYQLFYNLVNNALKFSKQETKPYIAVRSSTLTKDGDAYVEIIVSDNGIGFDAIHAERIFESFSRLNPKDRYEGTGLGLALCKKIVQRHWGTIEAKGETGVGASFIILLPVRQNTNGANSARDQYGNAMAAALSLSQ